MPPLYVDEVEIRDVWADGVQQDSVFADGVQVFQRLEFEDYRDDFLRSSNNTPIVNHLMNTGQNWAVNSNVPSQAVINPAVQDTGNKSSNIRQWQNATGDQRISPIVANINPSFVCRANFSWQNATTLLVNSSLYLDYPDTRVRISGFGGVYDWNIIVDGVQVHQQDIAPENIGRAEITLYYDGVSIQARMDARGTEGNSNQLSPKIVATSNSGGGRSFSQALQPALAGANNILSIYDITETGYWPTDLPWPA